MARRLAMVIDMNSCVGCMACTIACLRENVARRTDEGPSLPENAIMYSRTKPVTLAVDAGVPANTPLFIQCQHCDNAPCEAVCPTGATYTDENGVVRLDVGRCVGCRACVVACPYGARTIYHGELEGEAPHKYALHPGFPDKCNFCIHRAEEQGMPWTPACVEACAFNARIFGFMDDGEVKDLVDGGKAVQLLPSFGTKPKVFYVLPNKGR